MEGNSLIVGFMMGYFAAQCIKYFSKKAKIPTERYEICSRDCEEWSVCEISSYLVSEYPCPYQFESKLISEEK